MRGGCDGRPELPVAGVTAACRRPSRRRLVAVAATCALGSREALPPATGLLGAGEAEAYAGVPVHGGAILDQPLRLSNHQP
jgi:hypothetical protein